jgi:hypothetical protein
VPTKTCPSLEAMIVEVMIDRFLAEATVQS